MDVSFLIDFTTLQIFLALRLLRCIIFAILKDSNNLLVSPPPPTYIQVLDKYRQYNFIKLYIKSTGDEIVEKEIYSCLDTGNNIQFTAISTTLFAELK